MAEQQPEQLKKTLGLLDVYAISTGAMFSSGFFLLPGIASSYTGPSVILAYFLAGVLVLPAMFSQAELCTAMPKAGGTYYFLDRSLGPMAGTIGGLGTWFSLVFKSAFALIGMGAYLVIFLDFPIKPIAIAMTVVFTALNIFGAKETSGLQRALVAVIVGIMTYFIVQGLYEVFAVTPGGLPEEQFSPFMPFGTEGLITTIGLVFVSYAGLTKVASVSEEVIDPDRNIPLGMILSLLTATFVYVVGVFIMVAVLPSDALRADLTPVATAGEAFFDWMPEPVGLLLVVAAAIAAFASTGNAGILSASRYPLAMARDRLITRRFAKIGRFGTPTMGILITAAAMIVFIIIFNSVEVAKLASAFNLLIFGLLNLSVIVMRESHIPTYAPGYRSPLYPWMQIVGMLTAMVLIAEIGMLSIVFTAGVIVLCVGWYFYFVRNNVEVKREGAIYHLFERLGQHRYEGLDHELDIILEEKGFGADAPFARLIASATVVDLQESINFEDVVQQASELLADRLPVSAEALAGGFLRKGWHEHILISHGAALPHFRIDGIDHSEMVLVRCRSGICIETDGHLQSDDPSSPDEDIFAMFFLVSPRKNPGEHLRLLANIASQVDKDSFLDEWREAEDETTLKKVLLHYESYVLVNVRRDTRSESFIDTSIKDLSLPTRLLIALVRREGRIIIPDGSTVIREGDMLTVVGEPAGIKRFLELFSDSARVP